MKLNWKWATLRKMGFTANYLKPPSTFIAGRPKAALLFWFFGDVVCRYLSLFLLYINIKIGKYRC